MAERIVVGMSGGVDSSVAAAMLVERGWDVVGVTLHLWDYVREGHAGRCCAPEDQHDATRVCATLGIPHYTFDRRALFQERVVDGFVADYLAGRTPSPCVRCNESVKLGPLRDIARRLGATYIATGHYASVARDGDGVDLRAALDRSRDQSYFLWASPMEALRDLVLPLGDRSKTAVREHAARLGLATADKPDSTDLCFIEGGSYAAFIAGRTAPSPAAGSIAPGDAPGDAPGRAGVLETLDGTVVGAHPGVHHFTVGQRRGLGAGGAPRYVLQIVPERAAVVVGTADEALSDTVRVHNARWLTDSIARRVTVRLRYRHPGVGAQVETTPDGSLRLLLDAPQRGVAPGQAAVMYVDDRVVGGGWIA